ALHSTAEAGELVPRGPGGGKGAPRRGAVAGQQRGGIESRSAVHETTTGSAAHVSPRRDEPDALIGHVRICGRRRGQPRRRPGPTRANGRQVRHGVPTGVRGSKTGPAEHRPSGRAGPTASGPAATPALAGACFRYTSARNR